MPRLVEGISRFFGRVAIFALGLEGERQAAEAALAAGQPLEMEPRRPPRRRRRPGARLAARRPAGEGSGGRFAEVYADATVAWPLLVRAVLERLGKV